MKDSVLQLNGLQHASDVSSIKTEQQIAIPQEYKKLASYRRKIKNGKMWVVDPATGNITEAIVKKPTVFTVGEVSNDRIDIEMGKIYIEAINLQNANKRLKAKKFAFVTF